MLLYMYSRRCGGEGEEMKVEVKEKVRVREEEVVCMCSISRPNFTTKTSCGCATMDPKWRKVVGGSFSAGRDYSQRGLGISDNLGREGRTRQEL